jgi:hypothetical protein
MVLLWNTGVGYYRNAVSRSDLDELGLSTDSRSGYLLGVLQADPAGRQKGPGRALAEITSLVVIYMLSNLPLS